MMQTEEYWENQVKRSLCRFLLLAELAKGPVHGYGLNRAIRDACQGCCEPTEAMIYTAIKELNEDGYVASRTELHQGRERRICWLTPMGQASYQAAARVWMKVLPRIGEAVEQALASPVLSTGTK